VVSRSSSVALRERGITTPSGDVDALATAITRLVDDDALRDRLGATGRDYVEATHRKERLVADIIALVREVSS